MIDEANIQANLMLIAEWLDELLTLLRGGKLTEEQAETAFVLVTTIRSQVAALRAEMNR
jgi:predicted RNA-binding protein associated with RNAse of E/G family